MTGDRIAAAWYNTTEFTIDVNLTDGQTHKLSIYALDWDSTVRSERIDIVDMSGVLLDTETNSLPSIMAITYRGILLERYRYASPHFRAITAW